MRGLLSLVFAALLGTHVGVVSAQSDQDELTELLLEILPPLGSTTPQQETARAVAIVCPNLVFNAPAPGSAADQLLEDCSAIVGDALDTDGAGASTAFAEIAPDHTAAATDAAQTALDSGSAAVRTRVASLRTNATGLALTDAEAAQRYGMALFAAADEGSSSFIGRGWGLFFTGTFVTGDKDGSANEEGFSFDEYNLFVGADYRFAQAFVAGVGFAFSDTDSELDSNGGELDVEDKSFVAYLAYAGVSPWNVQADFTYGDLDYEGTRFINYDLAGNSLIPQGADVDQSFASEFDGEKIGASLSIGYDLAFGAQTLTPFARLNYLEVELDAFDERASSPGVDGAGWATRVSEQEYQSLISEIGARWSYAASQSWGVLLPYASAAYLHEFEDDERRIEASFVADPLQTQFFLPTDGADENFFSVAAGVSAVFGGGWMAFAGYDGIYGYEDVSHHRFSVGMRKEL